MTTNGSCLCGEVRFEVAGDFDNFFLCHCRYCRKDTGSAHASNLFSTSASLKWCSGESQVTLYRLPSTRHAKAFCSRCGSAVPQIDGKLLVVPAGSLDTPISIQPDAHLFIANRAEWDNKLEAAPVFAGLPGEQP